jgi:8-amino-7-oxononanoate synthase
MLMAGRPVLSLASNNYLGLANHPSVVTAARTALDRVGLGSGGSRLTTGAFPEHQALETALAAWKRCDDAVLFDSGYAANTGTIPALAGRGDLILSDELNHASLVDGCRLSRAEVRIYLHTNPAQARAALNDRTRFRRCLIVTDGVFSMDGDVAPLPALADLADEFDAWLVVDDAHGNGVMGPRGEGSPASLGVAERVPVLIGTLSKALGGAGGFAAGSHALCQYLRHHARSFVFSTAMPPAVAAGALAAVGIARDNAELRERLNLRAVQIRELLRANGFDVPEGETPIIPVIVGSESQAMSLSQALLHEGVLAPAIRYPTVPRRQARLRLTASAALTDEDIGWLQHALLQVKG